MNCFTISAFRNVVFLVSLILGIAIGSAFDFGSAYLFVTAFCLFVSYVFYRIKHNRLSDAVIIVTFLCMGAALLCAYPKGVKSGISGRHTLQFTVTALPIERSNFNTARIAITSLDDISVREVASVLDFSKALQYRHSYYMRLTIRQRTSKGRRFLFVWIPKNYIPHPQPQSISNRALLHSTRVLYSQFRRNCSDEAARLLASLLLGRRELIKKESRLFQGAGLAHLLAISGLHVGMLSFIILFIGRLLYIPYRLRLGVLLIIIFGYAMLSGLSPSVVRSVIMAGAFVVAYLLKRRVHMANVLAVSGIAMLIVKPTLVFKVGFQLSFLAVFAIIISCSFYPRLQTKSWLTNYCLKVVISSVFVSIFLQGLIAYYFQKIYILSPLYNLVAIPLFTILICGGCCIILFAWFPFVAESLGVLITKLCALLYDLLTWSGGLRFSALDCRMNFAGVISYYILLISLVCIVKLFLRKSKGLSLLHETKTTY